MSSAGQLYDRDFFRWTQEQADELRVAARAGSNLPLDWENLAEEVESLGKSVRSGMRSQIRRVIRHLLKLEHSPARDPRPGWRSSVRDARAEISAALKDSPSLKNDVEEIIEEQWGPAVDLALDDLAGYGEADPNLGPSLKVGRYSVDKVLSDWFPEK